jgi:hypothetical protein
VQTLWTFLHLQQHDRLAELHHRGRSLNLAGLIAMAVNKPELLKDEHRRLMADLGQYAPPDTAREQALALVADIEKADRAGAWTKAGPA